MIDLHAHPLPGLDDGPPDVETALALLEASAQDGVEIMAATPHLRGDFPGVRGDQVLARCLALSVSAERRGVAAPRLVPAAEVSLTTALSASDEELVIASYGGRGRDLLVETPHGSLPPGFEEAVFRLAVRGFRILLAHPERNPGLRHSPERLGALVRAGVLVQVEAGSIVGRDGALRRAVLDMIRDEVAHVIASDAHSPGPQRGPHLAAAVRDAERAVGPRARWMITEAPAAILAGAPLPPAPRPTSRRLRRRSRP